MTAPSASPAPAVPPERLLAWVIAALATGLALTALAVVAFGTRPGWWTAWAAAGATAIVSGLASLPLLLLGLGRLNAEDSVGNRENLQSAVPWILVAGVVRMLVVATGVVVCIRWLGTAKWPTFAFAGVLYALLMLAEVGLLGRALWKADFAAGKVGSGERQPVPRQGNG